jgi:hypothetical protein
MIEIYQAREEKLLTTLETARFLNVSAAFLAKDRWLAKKSGSNPVIPFVHIGGAVRYKMSDLLEYISENTVGGKAA